jgi:thymidine kinase
VASVHYGGDCGKFCGYRHRGLFLRAEPPQKIRMAKLYFHYATMNAGKSTMLLQAAYNYRERGMRAAIFIAALDDRAGQGRVASRIGLSSEAIPFNPQDDLFEAIGRMHGEEPIACVFIDEAQFLSAEQVWQLARVSDRIGVPVMAYGLRTDFQGKLFPGSEELLAIADELREVRTICFCGRKATMVVRLDQDGNLVREGAQVEVGGNEKYVSLCRRHWDDRMNGEAVAADGFRCD